MSLRLLLAIAFGGAFLTYFLGKVSSKLRDFLAVAFSLLVALIVASLYGNVPHEVFYKGFLGLSLILRLSPLAWLFAISISVVGTLSVIFSLDYIKEREKTDFYYLMMMLVNAAMLGIVLSGDLVSFFIFWEIMSWSAFLLISYNRGPALAAGMRYILMSIVGSVSMLVAIMSIYTACGTLTISKLAPLLGSASAGHHVFLLVLFFVAFGIKNAVWPFHIWLPPAHSEAPSPFSAVLSGILIKMGVYGFLLVMYVIVGLKAFLSLGQGLLSFHYLLCILGSITILIPTFIALLQDDSKRLLAWSTIGQAGYIILGIAFGTSLSITGGIFHFFNHAAFKALLFMVVGAVEYRTRGIRDLNSLGGLIKKMPVVFAGAMIGACALIGVPLTSGFVSKWLIYKALILEGSPFLAFAAFFGTWGTILYSYKLIHNMFLGQLPEKYKDIKRAPVSMRLPIIILSAVVILFGILPGIPLKVISSIGTSFGLESLNAGVWGIASETGALNTVNIFIAILGAGIVVWLISGAGRKTVRVAQDDNYAAGAYVPQDKYHYTVDFYNPLNRIINPYLKDFIEDFYIRLTEGGRNICSGIRRIYSGELGNYVMYIVLFLAVLIFVQMRWGIW